MVEQEQVPLRDIFAEIEEFEKTVSKLQDNIKRFKKKLQDNQKKYGPDMAKWPEKAQ